MHPIRRHAATALAVLAALAALAGCGSDGGTNSVTRGAERPGDTRAPVDTATGDTTRPAGPSPSAEPVLPDSRITPATGSFTAKEKKYLSGRVPENMDPAAVLEAGEEACQRVARTAKHDRDAAVGAVIAGDIPGAEDAIAQLCPGQKPVLRAAEAGFPDGTHRKPAAGTYRALTADPSCTWRAVDTEGEVLASGPGTGASSGSGIRADVPSGTAEFISSGCYAWVPV